MAVAKIIDVAGLNRTSVQYDPILRTLPFRDLKPRLAQMGFRFLSTSKELREASFERKGGISKPYVKGDPNVAGTTGLGKVKESKLVPEWGYTALYEDIMNYEDLNIVGNAPENVDPESKKHPQEMLIVSSAVKTVNEDILDALYAAKRDEDDESPFGLFDGIDTIITELVAAGEISTVKGNLVNTGAIANPVNGDTAAYDKLVAWLRTADAALKRAAIAKMPEPVYYAVIDALANKLQYKGVMSYDMLLNALKGDANFSGLVISVEPEMGTGNRIILTAPENFDFSLWTEGSTQFCQIRAIEKNPNLLQFYMQWKAGSRVRSWNKKLLMINDGTPVANQLSGDYIS
jgi:hypothetical protein